MMGDLRVCLYECTEHPMQVMIEKGMRCESLASIPLGDCWIIWGAMWEGRLPNGFSVEELPRNDPYYKEGFFTEGINGTSKPLDRRLRREIGGGEK